MARKRSLSKGELEVARVLWQLGSGTPREIYDAFPNRQQWDFATVQTFLRRLEDKGYIRAKRDGRRKVYSTRVQPKTVIRETVDDLLHSLFDGDSLPLLHHLIQDREITSEDIQELRQLLDQFEAQENDNDK